MPFDPYRVLGLPVGASRREIQRRYRQLLRRHHPDVSDDPERAHQFAAEIGRAYRMLMDDASRERLEQDLFRGIEPDLQVVVEQVDPARSPVPDLLARARELMRRERYEEAQLVCSEILALDPDSAEAYELLGRAYEALGLMELSREMFREAERLAGLGPAPFRQATRRARPAATQPEAEVGKKPPRPLWTPEPVAVNHWVEVPGVILAAGLVWWAVRQHGPPAAVWIGAPLSALALVMAAGFIAALGLAASGRLATLDQELGEGIRGAAVTPLWLLVYVSCAVAAPLGVVTHMTANLLADRSLRTWAVLWGSVACIAAAFGLLGHATAGFLWAGLNLLAIGALLGWTVGSMMSPREWWRQEPRD